MRGTKQSRGGGPARGLSTHLEPSRGADVVEVAQVVFDADVVEHAAQAAEGDAHSVGPAEAAELAAAL